MNGNSNKSLILAAHAGASIRLPRHVNPGLEIVLVEQGVLRWEVGGVEEVVPPGHVFFTLPWQHHGSTGEFEPGHFWRFAIVRLEGDVLRSEGAFRFPRALGLTPAENRSFAETLRHARRHAWPASERLAWAMRELVREHKAGVDSHAPAQRNLLALSIAELDRIIRAGNEPAPAPAPTPLRTRRVVREIEQDPTRHWSLQEMADLAGLRKSQFLLEFRRVTGDVPRKFLNRKRVEAARCALVSTDASITDFYSITGKGRS